MDIESSVEKLKVKSRIPDFTGLSKSTPKTNSTSQQNSPSHSLAAKEGGEALKPGVKCLSSKKSSIPVLRRNETREYEDISPRIELRRSQIPLQRSNRGSTDDLRSPRLIPNNNNNISNCQRNFDTDKEANSPSLIPKLLLLQKNRIKRSEETKERISSKMDDLKKPIGDDCPEEAPAVPINDDAADENGEETNDPEENVKNLNLLSKIEDDKPARSKEDDIDDNGDEGVSRRLSSHLSPEASPLSTRSSSRYSPRESESEPTPGLPRKIVTATERSESLSSQRIRDAISRTRRESNSTRYESSGSESIRLSESGLYDYVDLGKKSRLDPRDIVIENDERDRVQRDSEATSAGEDDHPLRLSDTRSDSGVKFSNVSSQGRTILRRRRQFDSQGSRRRGRSYARSYSTEDLSFQIARQSLLRGSGSGDSPRIPDYRRLVFISSDSSSGRDEEDDADSSCSGSSYLTGGIPPGTTRNSSSSHSQSLEDCDWDYFESNSLPSLPSALCSNSVHSHVNEMKDGNVWDCCLGRRRGSSASCLACGGSNRNVLPVPVPIPVPVPYPVPVPASLWNNGDFAAAAASSMIASKSDNFKVKNVAASIGPWFSWHPKFISQSEIHRGFYCDSKITEGSFNTADSIFTFRPDGSLVGHYESIYHGSHLTRLDEKISNSEKDRPQEFVEEKSTANLPINGDENSDPISCQENNEATNKVPLTDETDDNLAILTDENQSSDNNSNENLSGNNNDDSEDNDNSSCADSSDFDDDDKSHRFSRVFVVNNDDNDDNEDNDDDDDDSLPSYHNQEQDEGDNEIILKNINLLPINQEDNSISTKNSNEISYSADSTDASDDVILLRSIRNINPDDINSLPKESNSNSNCEDDIEERTDEFIVPDSLEIKKIENNSDACALSLASNNKDPKEKGPPVPEKKEKHSKVNPPNNKAQTASDDTSIDSMKECQVKVVSSKKDMVGENEVDTSETAGGETVRRGTRLDSVERAPLTADNNVFLPEESLLSSSVSKYSQNILSPNKYKSLVMITSGAYQPVSVITSDTTTLLQPDDNNTQQVQQQQQQQQSSSSGLAGYYHLALEALETPQRTGSGPRRPLMVKRRCDDHPSEDTFDSNSSLQSQGNLTPPSNNSLSSAVEQDIPSVSSSDKLSPHVDVILEEGLADDDSWVEEVSHDEDDQSTPTTNTEDSSEDEVNLGGDREEELRGYHRQAIDFTLHTIVEESCEESEAEFSLGWKSKRPPSTSELEKYFFFGLGGVESNNQTRETDNSLDSNVIINEDSEIKTGELNQDISMLLNREIDSLSETSSVYSEGVESLQDQGLNSTNDNKSANDFNSSRLEKYFLSEFLGFRNNEDRRDSDGSVGSDSEGRPSPEAQRRKRLVRARGTGRSHSSSLDNLLALTQSSQNLTLQNSLQDLTNQDSPDESDDSTVRADEDVAGFIEGVDTVKRKKKKRLGTQSPRAVDNNKSPELDNDLDKLDPPVNDGQLNQTNSDDERSKTPQADSSSTVTSNVDESSADSDRKQQSRDSGFVGSCDDLIQPEQPNVDLEAKNSDSKTSNESPAKNNIVNLKNPPNKKDKNELIPSIPISTQLSRKDSFNNWSSDEETNLMMSKMRQFFKTMVANSNAPVAVSSSSSSSSSTPIAALNPPQQLEELPRGKRTKPPQLVYFENELTRLMKTVPGIRDDQVREIVEYLSSEDTWSDSYDSSDYTSSDLEGAASRRSTLQEQISASCQQIISNFDINSDKNVSNVTEVDKEPQEPNEQAKPPAGNMGRDTAFVYQKLVQSFTKIAGDVSSDTNSTPHSSPPLIAKVMHHIGSRLVALMHQVSESNSNVPSYSWRRYPQHTRTPSSASTTEDDDSTSDSAHQTPTFSHLQLPRSKSHDPLLLIGHQVGNGPESEERETSDYERFSWRGSFESALMAADSRTKLSLLSSGDIGSNSTNINANALAMAAKRRSAGDLLFNPKSFSREQLDRVRSCGSIGAGSNGANVNPGPVEEKIWSNRRRSSVPDDPRHRRRKVADQNDEEDDNEDSGDEFEFSDSRAMTLPRGMQQPTSTSTTNSLPRLPAINSSGVGSSMHKAHSMYHFLPSNTGVKSARYRPPGFARNSLSSGVPKRALSAPGLELAVSPNVKRERRRVREPVSIPDEENSLSEACSTPIIGGTNRLIEERRGRFQDTNRASLSSLGARSDSMASVYSGAGEGKWCGSVAVRGEVEFSLQYDYKQLTFQVIISQCKDLAPVDVKRNRSDPYVKVYLLPDKSKGGKRKTKVKKHTLNPVFDETLKFNINLNSLETRVLWLTVWHSDMFGRNDFLGEVRMPLENKIFDDPTPKWYPLQERSEAFDDPIVGSYKGEVIVGLKFVPPELCQLEKRDREGASVTIIGEPRKGKKNWSRGSLHVLVKEARNLQTRAKNSGTCDPFCKSYLLPDKGRSGKQKTNVVRKSDGNPVWGHTFIYKDVSLQELAERGLELTVWDHDRIASNEFLGGVRFNLGTSKHYGKPVDWMDATGRELSLWQNMLERPNFWVEGAITLRPNLYNHGKHNFS